MNILLFSGFWHQYGEKGWRLSQKRTLLRPTPPWKEQARHTQPKGLSNVMILLLHSHGQYEVVSFTFWGVGSKFGGKQ